MPKKNRFISLLHYFARNLVTMLGIVLIWRGIWVLLDLADEIVGLNWRWMTAPAGIILGVLILYLPDKDLDEIRKL